MRPSTGTFRLNSISAVIFVALLMAAALSFLFYSIPMAGVLAMAGVLSILSVKIPSQWERVVVLRLGKFRGMRGPGLFFIIPFVDTVPYWIDLRLVATPFRAEQTLTKDNVPVDVDAVCFWKVTDPQRAALEVVNYYEVISWASQTALRDVIGKTELSEMLVGRELIDIQLKELIDHRTEGWGIHVQSVELRDVIIPGALQDAMSIQAQAERERQARIILGDSETQIAQKFEEAAKSYVNNPTALHLRAMNMLYEGLKEKGALIIVPSTAVETMGLGAIMGMTSLAKITQTNEKPITGEKG
ncbi:MAG: slipin family protein [candidate division NC10 bacterium]|nr:slipin family protein [candidate division NC10 bacterium]